MDRVLIVVDMQNDFIDGSLGTAEARKAVASVVEKIKTRKREGYRIILTLDTHGENYLSTREGVNLPVPHCVKGTRGWEINSDVANETAGCTRYEKTTFGSKELMRDLEIAAPEKIELVGLCTDICVVSNALGLKAFLPESEISVDGSCCAGTTPERHLSALETMKSCQINVI